MTWLAAGLMLPLLMRSLPGLPEGILLLAIGLLCAVAVRQLNISLLVLGMAWTFVYLHDRAGERLAPESGERALVNGTVSSFPVRRGNMLEFRFRSFGVPGIEAGKAVDILVRWYRDMPVVTVGENWLLDLELKPARSRLNFAGPDREKWYFSEGISALGMVNGDNSYKLEGSRRGKLLAMRQSARETISGILQGHSAMPFILALALADRSGLAPGEWDRFRVSGTSHLLAISGMHIGLAALAGYWAGRFLTVFTPESLALRLGARIPWVFSIGLAVFYAALSGLGTSTQRALVMLMVLAGLNICRRPTNPWRGLQIALVAVLVLNPLACLGAGFWFSFLAVAVLFSMIRPRPGLKRGIIAAFSLQAGIIVTLAPLGMLWFQQFTLIGLVANLVAIPWVSLFVVPPILLFLVTMPLDFGILPFLLFFAAEAMRMLTTGLAMLSEMLGATAFTVASPSVIGVIFAMSGGFLLLLPRGIPARVTGLLLFLPALLTSRPEPGRLTLEMLDVGQGLALVVNAPRYLLLYDTGPGDGREWSLARTTVIPAVTRFGRQPDKLIVSHADLDHAGGLHDLRERYPGMGLLANLRHDPVKGSGCTDALNWSRDGLDFRVLHPSSGLPYLGNDSSCVLSISSGDFRILLTGDISRVVEQRLLKSGLEPHQLLVVPHHGSKSSSSVSFVQAVRPEFALVSAGYQNRFGFPHAVVTDRLRDAGTTVWNSADCGAIRLDLEPGRAPRFTSARRRHVAIWHWPAAGHCP